MKIFRKTLLPILLGNCLFASAAFSQSVNVTAFSPEGSRPDTYIVQKGDTLYDLSGTYLGDVLLWPQLWSYNPQITNPHWIYPGDLLFMRPNVQIDVTEIPQADAAPVARKSNWVLRREFIPLVAILAEEDVKGSGKIIASPRDADMLKKYDRLWVKMSDDVPQKPKVGDYYIVYHETQDHIPSELYGDRIPYTVTGVVQITELPKPPQNQEDGEGYYGAKIVYSDREMERGDLLMPYVRQNLNVKIRPATTDLVGKIIYSVTPRSQLAEHNYLFIDKGSDEGVQVGNRFFVYQPGDPYLIDQGRGIDDIPMMRVGQLLVLSTEKNTSLVVVIDSKKEFEVGDRIEMYKGY